MYKKLEYQVSLTPKQIEQELKLIAEFDKSKHLEGEKLYVGKFKNNKFEIMPLFEDEPILFNARILGNIIPAYKISTIKLLIIPNCTAISYFILVAILASFTFKSFISVLYFAIPLFIMFGAYLGFVIVRFYRSYNKVKHDFHILFRHHYAGDNARNIKRYIVQ